MAESKAHPYQRGIFYEVMPLAPVEAACIDVPAGPIRFVVESRQLTNEILFAELPESRDNVEAGTVFDDFGATLHVYGADDGLEHLRFDCFEHEPHYHYIMHAKGGNLVCRIDEVAEGDPVSWTIGRVRERLVPMLELAGATELAASARADSAAVGSGTEKIAALLVRARELAEAHQNGGASG